MVDETIGSSHKCRGRECSCGASHQIDHQYCHQQHKKSKLILLLSLSLLLKHNQYKEGRIVNFFNRDGALLSKIFALSVILLSIIKLPLIQAFSDEQLFSEDEGVRKQFIIDRNDQNSSLRYFNELGVYLNNTIDSNAFGKFQQLIDKLDSRTRIINFDKTVHSRKALNELKNITKSNTTYEGTLKEQSEIKLVILKNVTTILITRWANKYYYWEFIQTALAWITFLMIVIGNLSILYRLKSCRRRRSNVNYFIIQLARADLLVGLFDVTADHFLRVNRDFTYGLFACLATKYISILFLYSSTNLLVALSIDRWEAVVKPLAFTKNPKRGYYLVATSWFLAFILALPETFYIDVKEVEGFRQCQINLQPSGWRYYIIYVTCTILVIPALIIAICYIHIVYTIWKKGQYPGTTAQKQNNEKRGAKNKDIAILKPVEMNPTIDGTTNNEFNCNNLNLSKHFSNGGLSQSSVSSEISAATAQVENIEQQQQQHTPTSGQYYERGNQLQMEVVLADEEEDEDSPEITEDDLISSTEDEEELNNQQYSQKEYYTDSNGEIHRFSSEYVQVNLGGGQQNGSQLNHNSSVLELDKQQSMKNNPPPESTSQYELKELRVNTIGSRQVDVSSKATLTHQLSLEKQNSTSKVMVEGPKRSVKRYSQQVLRPGSVRKTDSGGSQQHGKGVIPKARIKTIKMTLVIVLAFILCWTPFCIINLCAVFNIMKDDTYFTTALMTLSQSLAHLNSAINPIIFWLFSSSRRNNQQQNAQITTAASSEARTTGRGSLVKGLVAFGGYARKAARSHPPNHK